MSPQILAGAADLLAGAFLHGLRLLPVAVSSPLLGGPLVPAFVRVALAFGLGACAWSAGGALPGPQGVDLAAAALRELALGGVLSFFASLPIDAARAAGRLADTLRGATLSELHVAAIRQRETAVGDLLVQWTVVLASVTGGARLVVQALLGSFTALPVGGAFPARALLGPILHGAGELLACAACLGAPAAAGVLAADLAVALALRGAPQLGIQAAAQPARAMVGLAAVALSSAALAGRLTSFVALSAGLVAGAGARP